MWIPHLCLPGTASGTEQVLGNNSWLDLTKATLPQIRAEAKGGSQNSMLEPDVLKRTVLNPLGAIDPFENLINKKCVCVHTCHTHTHFRIKFQEFMDLMTSSTD